MPLILGLDPGSRRAGYGVVALENGELRVADHGVIVLNENWPLARRLVALASSLDEIYARHKIGHTVVEKIFFGKNADSAFKLGHARGVCLLLAAKHGSEVHEYAARFVKKCVTGAGGASKDHVQLVVRAVLGLRAGGEMSFDASDALALAVTHFREFENQARIRAAMEKSL